MRTPDDPDPGPWKPLGERVKPAPPPPMKDREIAPGVLQGPDGRLHTNLPLPKEKA